MKIVSVVGARPNFIKISPFINEIERHNASGSEHIEHLLVHTGQHYDDRMSKNFFESLNIPPADINLGVGSGSHAYQVGNTMIKFEEVIRAEKPDWVVVVGDVNATLACSVTAKKEHIKVCHIESGLRSGDMRMPEEINRLVTDKLSDLLLIPDRISGKNLLDEGVPDSRIKLVGNIMIDTLEANRAKSQSLSVIHIIDSHLHESCPNQSKDLDGDYSVITLHRPSNVDDKKVMADLIEFLSTELTKALSVVWPIHPRTMTALKNYGFWDTLINQPNIYILRPVGYHEMMKLNMDSKIVLTDSGGLQEECTVLGTPCLTLRWNTERPITLVDHGGVCKLVGNRIDTIRSECQKMLLADIQPSVPEYWDGKTAKRCLQSIINYPSGTFQ